MARLFLFQRINKIDEFINSLDLGILTLSPNPNLIRKAQNYHENRII